MPLKWIRGGSVFGPFDGESEDRSIAIWDGTDASRLTDTLTHISPTGALVLGANSVSTDDFAIDLTSRTDWAMSLPILDETQRDALDVVEGALIFNDESGGPEVFTGSWRTLVIGTPPVTKHALASWDVTGQATEIKTTNSFMSATGGLVIGATSDTPNNEVSFYLAQDFKAAILNRLTNTQRDAIASPLNGMLLYNTTFRAFHYYNGTAAAWKGIISGPGGATSPNSIPTFITAVGELTDTPTYLDETTGAVKFGENAAPDARVHAWDGDSGVDTSGNRQIITETDQAGGGLQLKGLEDTELGIHFGVPGFPVHGGIFYVAELNTGMSFRTGVNVTRLRIQNDGFIGVGNIEALSKLDIDGSLAVKRLGITDSSVSADEVIIAIESMSGVEVEVTILDEDIVDDRLFWIQDESGEPSNLTPITVSPESGTINGASSVQITEAYGSVFMYAQGGNLFAR